MLKLIFLSLFVGLGASCSQSVPKSSVDSDAMPPIRLVSTPPSPEQPRVQPPRPQRISRIWTLAEDVKVKIVSGGAMSFREGGRVEADFVRMDGEAAILKLIDGNNAAVPAASLCAADQELLGSIAGVVMDERSLNRAARWRKANLAAQGQAIAEVKAREEAQQIARFQEEQRAKAEAEWWKRLTNIPDPDPVYPPAVRGPWPMEARRNR